MVARFEEGAFGDDKQKVIEQREAHTPEQLLRTCLPCDIPFAALIRERFNKVDAGSDLAYLQFGFRSLCELIADHEGPELASIAKTMDKLCEVMVVEMAAIHAFLERCRREKEPDE